MLIEIVEENFYYNVCVELIIVRVYISKKYFKVLYVKLKIIKIYVFFYSCL